MGDSATLRWVRTGLLLAATLLFGLPGAQAQSVWQGTTSDYGTAGNWDNNTPPLIAGQSALFRSTGTTSIAVATPIAPDSWTFDNSSQGYSISGSAVTFGTATGLVDNASGQSITIGNNLAGTGAVSANDTNGGILILSGTNSYSGATTVSANAYLLANATTALSANSAFSVDGLLDLNGNSNSIKSLSGGAAGLVTSGTADAILTISGSASTSFGGSLLDGGAGSLGLTLAGTNTLALTGNDTGYSGATTIGSGATLRAGSVTAFSYNSNFTVNGTLDLGGFNNVIGSLAGSGTITNSGGTDAVLTTGFKNVASIFSGNITDGGTNLTGLTVDGSGALTLSGNNSYGGDTVICNCGILKAGSVTALSPNSFYTVDGKLDLNGFGNSIAALAGTGIITNDGAAAATLTITNAGGTDFGGNIQDGARALSLALTNSQQALSGNNSYTGATSVDVNSTLQAGSTTALSTGSAFSLDGLLDLNGFSNSIASLSDSGAGTGLVSNNGASDAVLTITGSANTSYSGQIADGGGAIGLTLSGTGTLTLTQSFGALYSGVTTIAAGATLKAGDSTAFSSLSDHTVNGTLDLNGFDNYIGALAGSGTVTNSGASLAVLDIFTANGDTIFSGSITDGIGHLGLSVSGPDKLILTGNNNSFSEGILICACAIVQVGNGGTTGSIGTGEIGDEGTLIINRSNIFLLSNDVSDAGSGGGDLIQAGTGTTILSGTNTYAGSTTINAGTLQVGNGGTAGTLGGSGAITDNGTLSFNRSDTVTLDRVVAGTGGLTNLGAGTLILTRDNSYSGTTTISAGTLQIGSGGTIGSLGTGSVVNNSVLVFNRSDDITVANAMSGSGGLTKLGSTALTLTGDNSYSGTTTISAGTLQVGTGGTTGSLGAGNIANSGALIVSRSDGLTIAGAISGAGTITFQGGGSFVLTGDSSYSGATTITSSTLQVGAGGTTGSLGTGAVSNTGTLVFNRTDTLTVANAIANTGALVQAGSGTLILTGTNSYSGGTTVSNSAGTLQVGDGGTSGSLGSGPITTNGTLAYNHSDALTVATAISGSGSLTQLGSGTLTLTGANSYTGTTIINPSRTLALTGGGSIAGSSSVAVNAGAVFDISGAGASIKNLFALSSSASVTLGSKTLTITSGASGSGNSVFAGNISGTGGVTISGGSSTFSGTNLYSGATTIDAGAELQISNTAASIAASSNVTVNGWLTATSVGAVIKSLNGSGTVEGGMALTSASGTFSGTLSGTGTSLTISGGLETLTGANSYGGATTISAGSLALSGGGSISDSSLVTADGTFDISAITAASTTIKGLAGSGIVNLGIKTLVFGAGTGVFSGTFTGTGTLQLSGGTTTFASTVANSIILDSGATLRIGNGGTSGAVTGAITNNGTVIFNRSDTVTLPATITGSGNLAQAGSGTLIVTNANNFGGVTISAGTLQVADGGSLGNGAIVNSGTLAFNRSDSVTFANAISGSGGLTKSGNGNLILTGTSSYTGTTTIAGGTLSVNGSIASSPVSVGSGGTLGGNGATGPVTVASGGKIAAGNSIGTLTVASLTLTAGSTTTVQLSPTASDRINVTGAAAINGALVLLPEAGTYSATSYRLIQAGSLTGTFSSVTGSVPGFTNTVQYSATAVDFVLSTPAPTPTPSPTPTPTPVVTTYLFGTYGNTPNQIAAGNSLANASSAGALYTALGALVGSDLAAVGPTFGLLAADVRPSLRAAAIEDSRILRNIILDRMDRPDGAGLWGAAFGGYGALAGDGNAATLHHDGAGFLTGLDFPVMPDIRLGIAGGYSTNHAHTNARLSTADAAAGHIGAYAAWHAGPVSMKLGGDYGFGKADVSRAIRQLGHVNASADDLQTSQVFADLGYHLALDRLALEPHLALAHVSATSGAFSETGSLSALSGGQARDSMTYAILGLRSQLSPVKLEDYELVPRLDLGWQHALSSLIPGQVMTYQTGNTSFLALGTPLARDAAAIQAGFDLDIGPALLSIAYDGSLAHASESHVLRGSFNWKF